MEACKREILDLLKSGKESAVISAGEMGTASWMAREIIESATDDGSCYESLWVSVTKTYDAKLLYTAIYDQLSSGSIPEEWEYKDENTELEKPASDLKVNTVDWEQDEYQNAENEEEEETIDNLKRKIKAQLKKRMPQGTTYLLLVLDYEGSNMDNNTFEQSILPVLSSINHEHLKIIITRCKTGRSGTDNEVQTINEIELGALSITEIELGALSPEESSSIFKKSVGHKYNETQFSKVIEKLRSICLPAPITVIGGALKYIAQHDNKDLTLESALLKAAAYYEKPSQDVNLLHFCTYDMMLSHVTKNCFWHSLQFVRNYGGVYYNELITHWIMEGYFNPVDQIEKAYQEGHRVLMELIDRAMLKMQENNIVVMEGAALSMIDTRLRGFGGTANLGLVRVFENGEGFGRVTHMDGMIKTLCNPKSVTKISTLMVDGARLNREVHEEFFSSMPKLKVLAVFNSTYKGLISSLSSLKELHVVVLRNCDLLDDATHIGNLKTLRVLEISDSRAGDSSLMSMPETLFDEMTQLQSLNLSGLQITSLPTLSNLRELRMLILRNCSRLKKLPSLKGLRKLEILDLLEARSLENFDDTAFKEIPNLQLIDLSHTKVQKLPVIGDLKDLTRILLRGCCNKLVSLPKLQDLTNLQILDLSGASDFRNFKFNDHIAELNDLKILNLSKTKIWKLPDMPCNLSELNLSGCSELVELSSIASLKNLELLDVSDAPKLAKIIDESFEHLLCLRYLNFSNTKISRLPPMPCNLSELNLSGCSELVELSSIASLKNLELLDISDAPKLAKIIDESFECLSCLRYLNFSNTKIESLPSLSNLKNLCQLLLKDCTMLINLPKMEGLVRLEELDLSGCSALQQVKEKIDSLQLDMPCLKKLMLD